MRKAAASVFFTALLVAVTSSPASAAAPEGACPTGWELYKASRNPATLGADQKGNQDGWACVRYYTAEAVPHTASVTDNNLPL
jgi:hypothetical protein